jgi:DNA replication protein DnaC
MGPYGCGKTHLAAAIANEAIQRGNQALFAIVPDLLDHLRSAFSPSSDVQYDELFERVRTAFLLILDDLGTESATPWAREKLYQIVNYRYNDRRPTVITTNRPMREIDDRIRSRMTDQAFCDVIEIKAEDYRQRRPGERRRLGPPRR